MPLDRDDAYDLANRTVKALETIAEYAGLELDEMRHRKQRREEYAREVADLHPGHDQSLGDGAPIIMLAGVKETAGPLGEATSLSPAVDAAITAAPDDDKAPSAG